MDHYRDALSLELLSAQLQAERTSGKHRGLTLSKQAERTSGKHRGLTLSKQAERTSGKHTALTLNKLALELKAQGKYDEAEPLYREALKMCRDTLGDRHPAGWRF